MVAVTGGDVGAVVVLVVDDVVVEVVLVEVVLVDAKEVVVVGVVVAATVDVAASVLTVGFGVDAGAAEVDEHAASVVAARANTIGDPIVRRS